MMLAVWLLLGFGIYYFVTERRQSGYDYRQSSVYGNKNTPEEILKERYAKGEIDEETYNRMRLTLNR